ncbi:S-layer protein, partial [Methanofervidicoccus abyssi]|uniref:S-layer protein n=1 Tax=Methanofervidicoccus abyssi TaxID=2082189 RepID=UPI001034AFC8
MKWKFLLIPILLMSLVGICYGENITVELLPSNIEANIGDTFNLSLIVKNVPEAEHEKCAGFETYICYDSNILNLSNIQLSNIGESADLKMVNLSSGFISLAWLFNPVYGNFTIATISFKGLNPGETNITLKNVVISTEDGYEYKNVSTYPATVVIKPYTTTITVTVPTPNLVIENITTTTPIYNNTPTEINITIANDGTANVTTTFPVEVTIKDDAGNEVYTKTQDVSGLNVNESITLTFNWTPTNTGDYNITAVVDSNDTVNESNESDNTYTTTITVVTLSSSTSSGSSISSSGGGGSPVFKNPYPDVAPDIKSIKIKEIVHKAKLIVGSNIDVNLSAKDLKTTFVLTNKPLDIEEDCILIGGPVANPIVKKYLEIFPVKVTNEYPGKHRGVIEVTKINGHTVVLLAGSDRWGTKAAVEYFKTLE